MKIVLTGASGLVGSHALEYFDIKNLGYLYSPTAQELDITHNPAVQEFMAAIKPDIVVNFAAYTNVTEAEKERGNKKGTVWRSNVDAVEYLTAACKKHYTYLIHISTDMVFSGKADNRGPYTEDHLLETTDKNLSWYGFTKLQAERLVKTHKESAIVRISNPVRAKYAKKLDYLRKIITLYKQGSLKGLFDDQYLTLTYIPHVSAALEALIKKRLPGVFHVSSTNLTTPHELGEYTLARLIGSQVELPRASVAEYLAQPQNKNRYLQYGGLATKDTQETLGITFHTWQEYVQTLIKEGFDI